MQLTGWIELSVVLMVRVVSVITALPIWESVGCGLWYTLVHSRTVQLNYTPGLGPLFVLCHVLCFVSRGLFCVTWFFTWFRPRRLLHVLYRCLVAQPCYYFRLVGKKIMSDQMVGISYWLDLITKLQNWSYLNRAHSLAELSNAHPKQAPKVGGSILALASHS